MWQCKKDVIDDGIECQRCEIWFHFGSCSDVDDLKVFIKEYRDRNRKFKCTECKKEKRGPGRPKLSKRKSPIKCKVPTKRRTILVEIPLKRNTKRTRKIREDEPSEETITDASKKDKSPIKKKSKADEGKNENENMKFPIKIRGEDVTKTDLDSLEEGQCVTSTIMDIFMKLLEIQYEEEIKEHNIQLIKSAPAYLIQKGKKHEITTALLDPIKLWEKGMALMVVSKKDNPDLEGGEHYSLLTYHKNDHTFLHMDPIKGINETCAKDLFINSMTKEMIDKDGHLPSYEEGDCTRQKNNYDCGPYTICYMWRMLDFIRTGTQFFVSGSTLGVEEKNMRQYMREVLMQEIKISKCMHNTDESTKKGENKLSMENPKMDEPITAQKITNETEKKDKEEISITKIIGEKIERTKQDMNKNSDSTSNEKNTNINTNKADKANNNDNIRNEYKGNKPQECRFFWRGTCRFGRDCWYKHTELCQDWDRRNECTNDSCKLNHPKKCYRFLDGECNSNRCRFLHPSGVKPRSKMGMNFKQQTPEYDRSYGKGVDTQETGHQEQNFGYQRNRGGNTRDNQMYMQQRGWPEGHMGRAEVSMEMFQQRTEERLANQEMKLEQILSQLNPPRY